MLANYTVQVRSVETGQLAGTTTSNPSGAFTFTGLNPSTYVIEVVNAAGEIIGTSAAIPVAAGATASLTVTAAAAAAIASGAAGVSTALVVATVAAGAGVAGVVVATREEASPSR